MILCLRKKFIQRCRTTQIGSFITGYLIHRLPGCLPIAATLPLVHRPGLLRMRRVEVAASLADFQKVLEVAILLENVGGSLLNEFELAGCECIWGYLVLDISKNLSCEGTSTNIPSSSFKCSLTLTPKRLSSFATRQLNVLRSMPNRLVSPGASGRYVTIASVWLFRAPSRPASPADSPLAPCARPHYRSSNPAWRYRSVLY